MDEARIEFPTLGLEIVSSCFDFLLPSLPGDAPAPGQRPARSYFSSLFESPIGGLSFGDPGVGIEGFYEEADHPTVEWFREWGIEPFPPGDLYVFSGSPQLFLLPVRLFSPLETQGLIHWGVTRRTAASADWRAAYRSVESEFYEIDGLLSFIEDRIAGREPWAHAYPFDNPTAMAVLRAAHPHIDYDHLDLRLPASHHAELLRPPPSGRVET